MKTGRLAIECAGPSLDLGRRRLLAGRLGAALSAVIPVWQLRAAERRAVPKPPKACILLWMNGGPSHLDTFDPKPGTKNGGPFKSIKTRVEGVELCEHLPLLAEQADKLAIIRSMTSKEGNHERGQYLMHTGYAPSVTLRHPSFGAWVSHELGDPTFDLPNFVSIRGQSIGAGFLGIEHSPFTVQQPRDGVRDLPYAQGVDAARFERRLRAFEMLQAQFRRETGASGIDEHSEIHAKAVRLMQSPLVNAFDTKLEPESVQQRYGASDFGRGCLMARRLVEAGVRFVEVTLDGWDTHYDNFTAVRSLLGETDPGMASLVADLADRDMLDSTLVVWMGEFGRTPRINERDGRDHYPAAWSAVLAGGGMRVGHAYGATNEDGTAVTRDPITVPDFFATLATLMSMDPAKEMMSPVGRPIAITDSGTPIRGLIDERA